jgi:molybdopterin molybdotransferase
MQGQAAMPKRVIARCINGFGKAANSRRLVRARAWYGNSGWEAEVLPGQKPSMIRSLLQCNALIDIAAGSPAVPAGSSVEVMLL